MRLWPHIAELQAEWPRRLTPRRLGYLEAVSAPCLNGGTETRETLAVERAILFGPAWVARRMVRGSVWASALLSWPWRPKDAEAAVREIREYLAVELWAPEMFVTDSMTPTDPARFAFGAAWHLVVTAVRLGFGHPSRHAPRSAWDASCAEIVAHSVCSAELDKRAEFESRDEVEALLAAANAGD